MVKHCTAAGCFNTYKDGANLSVYSNSSIEAKIDQVQRTRAGSGWSGSGSEACGVLCSVHFE